jgi:serine/threonine-protein kinase
MLKLLTLGTLDLRRADGGRVTGPVDQRKRMALLVYLATGAGETRSRDTLLGMFWPGLAESGARRALNQALFAMRTALGRDVIESCGTHGLSVSPQALWCDAVAFDVSLRRGREAEALGLYAGDFAPGLYVSGCSDFDQWVETTRHSLRVRAAHAASSLSAAAAAIGHFEESIAWARRQLEVAPHDESAVRSIIRQLAELGDRAEAVDVYESFAKRLRDELLLDPSPETARLVRDIRSARPEPASIEVGGFAAPPVTMPRPVQRPVTGSGRPSPRWRAARIALAAGLVVAAVVSGRSIRATQMRAAARTRAVHLYDLGRTFSNRRTPSDLRTSITLFRQATAADGRYAAAYGGLAESYTLLAWYDTLSPRVAARLARDAAQAGLRLDARLSAAHASLGASNAWLDGTWSEASRQFRQAIAFDSLNATAYQWYGLALASAGYLDSARAELEIAARRDPSSAVVATDLANVLFWCGRYDAAVAQARRALTLDPRFRPAITRLWRFYAATGDLPRAFEALEGIAALDGATARQTQDMRDAYTRGGWRAALSARARMLQAMPDARPERNIQLATILGLLGRDTEALSWLRRVHDAHELSLRFVPLDPAFTRVTKDPRFRDIVRSAAMRTESRQGG